MVGRSTKPINDYEFVDPNKIIKRAPNFVSSSGKKQLAIHQVFLDHKAFNEVLRDCAIKKKFEYYIIKNSIIKVTAKFRVKVYSSYCTLQHLNV